MRTQQERPLDIPDQKCNQYHMEIDQRQALDSEKHRVYTRGTATKVAACIAY